MAKRIYAASVVAILGLGSMLTSDVAARSGGGGHHGAAMGALRAPVGKTVAHARAVHVFRGAHHNRHAGLPLRGWWSGGWYGSPYIPSSDLLPIDRPTYGQPSVIYPTPVVLPAPKLIHVIPYRPGCSSETQSVPWRDGKDHAVTIVRC